jgi:HK97 gp10 family phage protein
MTKSAWDFSQQNFRAACVRGLLVGGNVYRNKVLDLILRGTKSGRLYRRRGTAHRASAPGEAPASDLGDLVRGIQAPRAVPGELAVDIASSSAHAALLEFGTSRMAARPYMRPAAALAEDDIADAIFKELRSANWGVSGGTTIIQAKR